MKKNILLTVFTVCLIFHFNNLNAQTFILEDKVIEDDFGLNHHFAHYDAVSIDGDYAVVGSHNGSGPWLGSGNVNLFKWNEVTCEWDFIDVIVPEPIGSGTLEVGVTFGWSVCIKDKIITIGAPLYAFSGTLIGRVFVYEIVDDEAVIRDHVFPRRNDFSVDGDSGSKFGLDLDWDGQNLIVSALNEDEADGFPVMSNAGACYIYHWNGSTFDFVQKIFPSDRASLDNFGFSVGISGIHAIIGAPNKDNSGAGLVNSGAAYVFEYDSGSDVWTELQTITAPFPDDYDEFGISVDLTQGYCVVGAWKEDEDETEFTDGNTDAGSVYIYEFDSGTEIFEPFDKIVASDRDNEDAFGEEVKIVGNNILVSAPSAEIGLNVYAGKAYMFNRPGAFWIEDEILLPSLSSAEDFFGEAIDLSFDRAIIGAPYSERDEDDVLFPAISPDPAPTEVGSAYIYGVKTKPIFNSILISDETVCSSVPTTLTVYGDLNDAYGWEWYEGSCDGELVGEGEELTIELTESTVICVRAAGCFDYDAVEDCNCVTVGFGDDYWHQHTTDGIVETPSAVTTDAEGNVYVTGTYAGFADFDGGGYADVMADDGVPGFTYSTKIFVAKYDNCGNLLWISYSIGNVQNEFSNGIALRESEGVLYIVGEFTNTFTMMNGVGAEGIGAGSATITETGTKGFVAQIDRANGELHFIESVAGTSSLNRLTEITINENNGAIYVGGQTYNSPGLERIFIKKYHPIFTGLQPVLWERTSLYAAGAKINGMDYDESSPEIDGEGALWITGEYRDNLRMTYSDPWLTTGAATTDAFVLKYFDYNYGVYLGHDATLELLVKGNIESVTGNEMVGNDIAVDAATGNAYITGTKIGVCDDVFDLIGEDLAFAGGNQVGYFIAMQYDGDVPIGSELSEITFPSGPNYCTGMSVTIKNDNVYFTGTRRAPVRFQSLTPFLPYIGVGESHLYVVSYNLEFGNYEWANGTLNPDFIGASPHLPTAITSDDHGHAFIVGNFINKMGYLDGSPSSGNLTYTSNGGTLFTMRVDIDGMDEQSLQSPLQDDLLAEYSGSNSFTDSNDDSVLGTDNDATDLINLRLYPNPTSDKAVLLIDNYLIEQEYLINIYSVEGKIVFSGNIVNGRLELNLANFESGLYIINIQADNFNQRLTLIKTQ